MEISSKAKKVVLALAVFAVVLGVGYWFSQLYKDEIRNLPEEFTDAREEGALVAEKIVFLTHQSLAGLEQIGGLDENKKYGDALKKVEEELERNQQARDEALLLSSHLGVMAAYLAQIEPAKARAIATDALGHEVNLVNRLINFHGLLQNLFQLLEGKFKGRTKNSDSQVKRIIDKINSEVKAINNLNMKFNESMEEFDSYFVDN